MMSSLAIYLNAGMLIECNRNRRLFEARRLFSHQIASFRKLVPLIEFAAKKLSFLLSAARSSLLINYYFTPVLPGKIFQNIIFAEKLVLRD